MLKMESGQVLQELAQLHDIASNTGGTSTSHDVTLLRARLWQLQLAIDALQRARDEKYRQVYKLHTKVEELKMMCQYHDRDILQLEAQDHVEDTTLELVPVDQFLQETGCEVDPNDSTKFLLERYRDEERRRIGLFQERVALEKDAQNARKKLETMRRDLMPSHSRLSQKFKYAYSNLKALRDSL